MTIPVGHFLNSQTNATWCGEPIVAMPDGLGPLPPCLACKDHPGRGHRETPAHHLDSKLRADVVKRRGRVVLKKDQEHG